MSSKDKFRHKTLEAVFGLAVVGSGGLSQVMADDTTLWSGLQITATRSAHFATAEGTWLSLDVSPDGRTIVFDMIGQLYTLPITGGTARAITHSLAWNAQPRFSPDGGRIVFTSDRSGEQNLWTIRVDGTDARQLSHSTWKDGTYVSPVWSPDRKLIVATKVEGWRIYEPQPLVEVDWSTGVEIQLTDIGGAADQTYLGPAFGPSADTLYATRLSAEGQARLVRVHVRPASQPVEELNDSGGRTLRSAFRPALSRDGHYLAYAAEHDVGTRTVTGIRLRDLGTGKEQWIVPRATEHAPTNYQSRDVFPGYAFTPDSRALVLAYGGKIHRVDVTRGTDQIVPFEAHVDQPLGPLVAPHFRIEDSSVLVRGVSHPSLSPDGRQLAFSALGKVWVMQIPSGTPRRVTPTPRAEQPDEFNPTWSPDGRFLAYTGWDERTGGALYRIPTGGGMPERLTSDAARYENVRYSPDGRWLVAICVAGPPAAFPYASADVLRDSSGNPHLAAQTMVRLPADGSSAPEVIPGLDVSYIERLWQPAVEPQFVNGDTAGIYVAQGYPYRGRGVTLMRLSTVAGRDAAALRILWAGIPFDRDRKASGTNVEMERFEPVRGGTPILSPDGRFAVAQAPGGHLYLICLPMPIDATLRKEPLEIEPDDPTRWNGARVERIWGTGGDRIEWALDSSYFAYSAGPVVTKQHIVRDPAAPSMLGRSERIEIRLTVSSDRPEGTVVLRGARIVTMRNNQVIPQGDIVIHRNRIIAIGAKGAVTVPSDAHIIDVSAKTIIPGFIDIHDHLYNADHSVFPRHPHLYGELAYGITSLRDPLGGVDGVAVYDERAAVGDWVGPRSYSTYQGIDASMFSAMETEDQIRGWFRKWSTDYHGDLLKFVFPGSRRRRELALMAAQQEGLFPTNHIEGDANMLSTVFDGYGGLEHMLQDVPIYDDVARLFAFSRIVLTPTFGTQLNWFLFSHTRKPDAKQRRFTTPTRLKYPELDTYLADDDSLLHDEVAVAARIVAAGGKIGLGGHGQITGLGSHWELWLMAWGGMPNIDVLKAGTIWSAEGMGHSDDLGSLEIGKLADLQILDKNPLDDIHNTMSIRYVMKNGRLYDASDLTEIWPRHKAIEPFWWWDDSLKTRAKPTVK